MDQQQDVIDEVKLEVLIRRFLIALNQEESDNLSEQSIVNEA